MCKEFELWEDIPGWEGVYKININGQVKGYERLVPRDKKGGYRVCKERILKQKLSTAGYKIVDLSYNGVTKRFFIHRLLAYLFIPNPFNKDCVNHKNGIKTDNRVENLEWCTKAENNLHAYRTGLKIPAGVSYMNCKPVLVTFLKETKTISFPSIISASRHLGMCEQSARNYLKKRQKSTVYNFELL